MNRDPVGGKLTYPSAHMQRTHQKQTFRCLLSTSAECLDVGCFTPGLVFDHYLIAHGGGLQERPPPKAPECPSSGIVLSSSTVSSLDQQVGCTAKGKEPLRCPVQICGITHRAMSVTIEHLGRSRGIRDSMHKMSQVKTSNDVSWRIFCCS